MRFAVLLFLAGCPALDVGEPISLMPASDWNDSQRTALANSAACWNMEFGTQLVVGDADAGQQVSVSFSDFVCTYSQGRTEPNLPVEVRLCRHWFPSKASGHGYFFFHVLLHELGHVLNIRLHAGDPHAVMASGEAFLLEGGGRLLREFSDEDRRMFRDSNPDFAPHSDCAAVTMGSIPDDYYGCKCFRPKSQAPTDKDLLGVWATEDGQEVWAVGREGTIVHHDGKAWQSLPSGTTKDLHAVDGDEQGNVWIVGAQGTILHWGAAKTLLPQTSGTTQDLHGVAASWGDAWAVGDGGTILRRGATWSAETSPTKETLRVARAQYGDSAWAAGDNGVLVHYDGFAGAVWRLVPSGTEKSLLSLWDDNRDQAVAVGVTGTLAWACDPATAFLCYGGEGVTALGQGALRGMWGETFYLWAVGDTGTVVKLNNHYSSTPMVHSFRMGITQNLNSVWGDGKNGLWVVGDGGTLVHLDVETQ